MGQIKNIKLHIVTDIKETKETITMAEPTPSIPETLLKRRKNLEAIKASRAAATLKQRKSLKEKRQVVFKRAEQYTKEYRAKERDEIRLRRMAKRDGNFYVPAEAKLVFVILNKSTLNMLRLVEPFVAWGYPNLKTIRELVYKRGFAKVNHQRIPISNNEVVEEVLGSAGIICVEDLIHEIFTVGDNFKKANNFLWPFKLSCPTGGMRVKTNHFVEGGDHGNREDFINQMVRKMN